MQANVRPIRGRTQAAPNLPLQRPRFWIVCLFFVLWAFAIGGRLIQLQVFRHEEFVKRAQLQQQRTIEVLPRRGILYDRNLHELAMTVQVDSLYALPADIEDKQAAARQISALVHTDPEDTQTTEEQIAARLNSGHNSVRVARGVSAETSARAMALGMKGIFVQKEFGRFYPDNEIAAQVLGFVGVDDNGLGGIEQKFEAQLHGVPGYLNKAMDARRHVRDSSERDPQPGQNLVLTIDANMQFLAERALDHAMQRTQAENGTVVVQDVHTGQILALAIRPTFNPNNSRHTTPDLLRNHAVSDVYEPGSTFKLVTYSAALEQRVTSPDDTIDCQGGQIKLAGRTIHDDKGEHYGRIKVHEALEHSSDVAAVKLALKVGPDRFYQFVRDFGFGARTGVEMPGETRGLLQPVKKWSGSSIGSIAIGQEIGVTPVQLVSMVSTIANGGVYLPPHVLMPGQFDRPQQAAPQAPAKLQAMPFKPGGELPDPLPSGAHRVLSTLTAAEMRKMMEGVVLYGTGKEAQLNGYSSGGKTGTAQKIDPKTHHYSPTMHIASFAGIAPVNNPVIAVAVVLDDPKGDYHGATVSAPVFAEVAQQMLEYLGVAHDIEVRHFRANGKNSKGLTEDDAPGRAGDPNALYSAVNDLPSDDPLRAEQSQAAPQPAAQPVNNAASGQAPSAQTQAVTIPAQTAANQPHPVQPAANSVTLSDTRRLQVPSLVGLPIRKVIEAAAGAGFEVQISGNGTAREQSPAAGTMVEPGTQIQVRCGH
jgi:cell division protein FtsI (penicillin-binding protein 3)